MNKALYGLASCVCTTAIFIMTGALFLSVPACYASSGFLAIAFIYMLIIVQSAYVALLPYLAITAIPGYFGGKRAIQIELALIAILALALIAYGFVPHPYATWDVRCRLQTP